MQNIFSIDGFYFDVEVLSLKRKFAVLDGSNTGRTLDGKIHRDIIGTFYNYSLAVDCKLLSLEQYDELFELISDTSESHMITVPYGQASKTFEAYITSGEDDLKIIGNKNIWSGLAINFIATKPERIL